MTLVGSYINKISTPTPKIQIFPLSLSSNPASIYQLNGTSIHLVRGNIITSKFKNIDVRSLSAKTELSKPHRRFSIDGQVWTLNCEVSDIFEECQTKFQIERDSLFTHKKSESDIWVGKLPTGYVVDTIPMAEDPIPFYFIAGLDANEENNSTTQTEIEKLKAIEEGLPKLCEQIKQEGYKNLAIPIFGSGAANIEFENALNTILKSINDAILKGKSPDNITIVVWPGSEIYENDDVRNEEKFRVQTQEYNTQVRKIKEITQHSSLYDKDKSAWDYLRKSAFITQVLQLITAPLFSGLLFIMFFKKAPIRVTWTVILEQFILYVLAITGIGIGKLIIDYNPLNWIQFIIVFSIGLVVPAWRWLKLGEPNEKNPPNK